MARRINQRYADVKHVTLRLDNESQSHQFLDALAAPLYFETLAVTDIFLNRLTALVSKCESPAAPPPGCRRPPVWLHWT